MTATATAAIRTPQATTGRTFWVVPHTHWDRDTLRVLPARQPSA